MEAIATSRPVLVADVADGATGRWPTYMVRPRGARGPVGVRLPVGTGTANLGALDVFRARAGRMSEDDVTHAVTFAEIARVTILDGQHQAPAGPCRTASTRPPDASRRRSRPRG